MVSLPRKVFHIITLPFRVVLQAISETKQLSEDLPTEQSE